MTEHIQQTSEMPSTSSSSPENTVSSIEELSKNKFKKMDISSNLEMPFSRNEKRNKRQRQSNHNSGIPEENTSIFVTFIIKLFRKWAYFITQYDWQAILICILISSLAIVKLRLTKQQNDVSGYSPNGARAREEYRRYQQFFSNDEGVGLATYIFALAKDQGSMLREKHLKEIVEILDYTSTNFMIFNENLNKSQNFNEFCVGFCQINEPVRQFYNAFTIQTTQLQNHQPLNPRLILQYPISSIYGREISLQNNFFGIKYSNNTSHLTKNSQQISNMNFVKMMGIQFRAQHKNGWKDDDVKKFELDIVDFFENKYASENLEIYAFSRSYIEKEMVRAGRSIGPWFGVGFLIMCICAISTVLLRAYSLQQHSYQKIILAIFACILPFLSCATGLALMFLAGFRFASILCVIPFLVLAIGIDSSYLMIHEWQRVVQECRKNASSDLNNRIEFRMSEMLAEVGPAILISTLTNILADSVGAFISSPEIALLCIGNALSMAVAFCFQITFYAGLMSLIGKNEIKMEAEERKKIKANVMENKENEVEKQREITTHSSSSSTAATDIEPAFSNVLWTYVNFIANRVIASGIIFLYFVYIGFSIYGITKIDVNLSNEKLFKSDSRLLKLSHYRLTYLLPHYTMATVFINQPGNLSNPSRLQNLNNFVADMEKVPGSWGPNGTKYFIRDFLKYQASFNEEEFDSVNNSKITVNDNLALYREEDLSSFLSWPEYSFWKGFVRLNNDSTKLEKFFFTCAYFGKNLGAMTERGRIINEWRDVVDKYADEFDASVYHEDAIFTDLISNIPTDTWQAVVGAVICIGFICYIFLNNWFAVIIATTSVLSICTGILGFISWWGVDLDPISVAAMIICVGSSCDLPAHTSFHYYLATVRQGHHADPKIKLVTCLSTIGFPVLQAAASMILCILALCFVGLYMATVFVKAMLLCVFLCLVHALIIIPAFLVLHDYIRFSSSSSSQNESYSMNNKESIIKHHNISIYKSSVPSTLIPNKI